MTTEELVARHQATLEAFVMRARRVEAHSLCSDKESLVKLAQFQLTLEGTADTRVFLIQRVPPEEQIESAAARIRPLLLNGDVTYYAKTLGSLKFFVKNDQELAGRLKKLRDDWIKVKDGKQLLGLKMIIQDEDGEESGFVSDLELAFAYIYGDVVHHDPDRLAATKLFGVRNRYRMAAPIVAHVIVLTLATLNLLRRASSAGLVELDSRVFSEEVVVTETEFRLPLTAAYSAPVWAPSPESFDTPNPAVWSEQHFAAREPDITGEAVP